MKKFARTALVITATLVMVLGSTPVSRAEGGANQQGNPGSGYYGCGPNVGINPPWPGYSCNYAGFRPSTLAAYDGVQAQFTAPTFTTNQCGSVGGTECSYRTEVGLYATRDEQVMVGLEYDMNEWPHGTSGGWNMKTFYEVNHVCQGSPCEQSVHTGGSGYGMHDTSFDVPVFTGHTYFAMVLVDSDSSIKIEIKDLTNGRQFLTEYQMPLYDAHYFDGGSNCNSCRDAWRFPFVGVERWFDFGQAYNGFDYFNWFWQYPGLLHVWNPNNNASDTPFGSAYVVVGNGTWHPLYDESPYPIQMWNGSAQYSGPAAQLAGPGAISYPGNFHLYWLNWNSAGGSSTGEACGTHCYL